MANKNIILDTIYVLPLFGIDITLTKSFPNEIKKLWKHGIQDCSIYMPNACLIEVLYKLNKEFRQKSDAKILDRYSLILPTILTSPIVKLYDCFSDITSSQIAMAIRKKGHNDIMDCWIASCSVALQGVLVSEDEALKKVIKQIPEFDNISIFSWIEFKENIGYNGGFIE